MHSKFNKKILIFLICIPIIIIVGFLIYIMCLLFGTNTTMLNDISNDDKIEILNVLNLEIETGNVVFEKIETPKTYKDIYYNLYFSISSEDKNKLDNIKTNTDLTIDLKEINEKNGKIEYKCSISNMGKSINVFENIIDSYQK